MPWEGRRSLSLWSALGLGPLRKPEDVQRREAQVRIEAFLATRPLGAISFGELRVVAQEDAPLPVFVEVVAELCRSRVLEQFVRVDADPAFEYADFTAVPSVINGRPMLLERAHLYYRTVAPRPLR